MKVKKIALAVTCGLAGAGVLAIGNSASGQGKVQNPRLYVLDCGTLIYNNPESYNLTRQEVRNTNMSAPCYLIVHPKGTILFDAGLGDRYVGRPFNETPLGDSAKPTALSYYMLVTVTLKSQLEKIGYPQDKIDFLAISHTHSDHNGNVRDFGNSTWLLRKTDYDDVFGPKASPVFAPLKAKAKIIEGDYDVFGDRSVVLLSTPGHTPGHQSLYVKLVKTGGVVLSGDLYHYPEERSLNRMPDREKTTETAASRAKLETFLNNQNAELWIGHDISLYSKQKHAPEYYE